MRNRFVGCPWDFRVRASRFDYPFRPILQYGLRIHTARIFSRQVSLEPQARQLRNTLTKNERKKEAVIMVLHKNENIKSNRKSHLIKSRRRAVHDNKLYLCDHKCRKSVERLFTTSQ